MKLEHSFSVPVGVDDAWKILLDIERIGPCMPGAAIDSVDGDDFTGTVKVKLGPIGLTYKGKASFIEKDESAHRAVIDARGRDARGNGTASAKVTATMVDDSGGAGTSTLVKVDTDLDITGKPAQFGRGVMTDVGNKLIGQFADNLSQTISGDSAAAEPAAAELTAESAAEPPATEPASAEASPATPKHRSRPRPARTPDDAAAGSPAGAPITEAAVEAAADAPAAYAAPGASAEAVAPLPDEAETSAGAAGNAPAALSAPAESASASANGRQTKPATRPDRNVEPINLIESAGPAVAKRLAPVAAALVLALVVLRRLRSR